MTEQLQKGPPKGDWLGTPYLKFERRDGIGWLTLNRPEKRNAMTAAMYFGIRYAVQLLNTDESLAGLLITGTGDALASGGDLSISPIDWWTDFGLFGIDATPFDAIRQSPKPVVVAANGITWGGGLMISMLSDVCVASERATFRVPELLRGIADTYYAQILPRQIGPARARDLILTGRTLNAAEALDWGLIARVAPHDKFLDEAIEALKWCIRCAPEARREAKRFMDEFYGYHQKATMVESTLFGAEAKEGWQALKEKRDPSWVPQQFRLNSRY